MVEPAPVECAGAEVALLGGDQAGTFGYRDLRSQPHVSGDGRDVLLPLGGNPVGAVAGGQLGAERAGADEPVVPGGEPGVHVGCDLLALSAW